MARVTVTPETFTYVNYDNAHIASVVARVADVVGLPADAEVHVDIDEGSPLVRTKLTSVDPIAVWLEGGAFEDLKRPRQSNDQRILDVLGRWLFRASDRLDPAFGDPPPEEELTLQQSVAWDAYAVGRCERAGFSPSKSRRLYHFRNRHGFTDVADAAFERLWTAERATWADIEAVCRETAEARAAAAA